MPNAEKGPAPQLAQELLSLYDEFSEFEAYCAFFCDAVAALGATGIEPLGPSSAGGLVLAAERVKADGARLKGWVDRIRLNAQARM